MLCCRAEIRHRDAFLIGDIGKQSAVAAGDRNQADAALVLVRPYFCPGKQRDRIDQIVEIIDDNRAMLLEKRIPSGRRTGKLPSVRDHVTPGALGLAGAQDQHALSVFDCAIQRNCKAFRLLRSCFKIGRNDIDLRTFGLIGKIVGGIEHDLVAAAGANVKAEAPFGTRHHQQIHHAAALKNAADVAGAQRLRKLAAPNAEFCAHRNKSHAVGAE